MINILKKIKELKATDFYKGIEKTPYEYSNKPLATCIKEKGSFDVLIAHDAEIIGRALLAERNREGKELNQEMYNKVRKNFFDLPTDNKEYIYVADTYSHAGDQAICKYLIATWKHGDELGRAIGLDNEAILTVKNAVKNSYMPQSNQAIQASGHEI